MHDHNHHHAHDQEGKYLQHINFKDELLCHFPYAILSVAISMIFLSLISNLSAGSNLKTFKHLFHDFHFLHLVFSGTGAVLIFRKYSKSISWAIGVGFFVPVIFCTLSDSIMPYIGGKYLGLSMQFHWCFVSHFTTVLPFLLAGILNGFIVSSHSVSKQIFYSTGSHFLHIFVSSMASMLYFVSFGFSNWHDHIGFVFLFLILAVLIPCTLADIVVPMLFAHAKKKLETQKI